jgi:hypothetical protein
VAAEDFLLREVGQRRGDRLAAGLAAVSTSWARWPLICSIRLNSSITAWVSQRRTDMFVLVTSDSRASRSRAQAFADAPDGRASTGRGSKEVLSVTAFLLDTVTSRANGGVRLAVAPFGDDLIEPRTHCPRCPPNGI